MQLCTNGIACSVAKEDEKKTSVRINTKMVNYKKNDKEIINLLSDREQKDDILDVQVLLSNILSQILLFLQIF
jgi:hypothetical protein